MSNISGSKFALHEPLVFRSQASLCAGTEVLSSRTFFCHLKVKCKAAAITATAAQANQVDMWTQDFWRLITLGSLCMQRTPRSTMGQNEHQQTLDLSPPSLQISSIQH